MKIFFATYGAGHVRIAIPIIRKLLEEKRFDVSVLGLTSSVVDLAQENISFQKLSDYEFLFRDSLSEIRKLGAENIENNYERNSKIPKEEILFYLGLNLWDLKKQFGKEKSAALFLENRKLAFSPLNAARRILSCEQPDLVVLTSEQRFEKAVGLVANEMEIPVLRCIDLLGEDDELPFDASLCVMSNFVRDNILKRNPWLNEDRIFVTGIPTFNIDFGEVETKNLFQKTKYSRFDKVISFFSQPVQKSRKEVFQNLRDFADKNKNILIIIKPHPNENDIEELLSDCYRDNLVLTDETSPYPVIKITDLVITFFSTVGLQAVIYDKPVINVNFDKEDIDLILPQHGGSIEVNNADGLEKGIHNLLDNNSLEFMRLKKNREKFVNVKHSSTNIVNAIRSILNNE